MHRVLKLRGDQERRRFFVGVAVDASCTTATAAIVAATSRGLEARFEVASHVVEEVPREMTALYRSLDDCRPSPSTGDDCGEPSRTAAGVKVHPSDAARLAAQLADVEATAIERLAEIECDVWPRVLLAGVSDPGLWQSGHSASHYLSLCDSARLAELSGLNIVDAFPARDMVQEGRGGPLDAIPLWLLLHHIQSHRLLIQLKPSPRAVYLPAARNEAGVHQLEVYDLEDPQEILDWLQQCIHSKQSGAGESDSGVTGGLTVDELLLLDERGAANLPIDVTQLQVLDETALGISAKVLPAACAAVLGMLHIDQTPGNVPKLTGAAAPRVLGRLTPGSAHAWNRLLRDLAFVRPLITPLRAAI